MKIKAATDITVEEVKAAELAELVVYERLLSDHASKQAKGWRFWNKDKETRFLLMLVQTRLEDIRRTREVREYFFKAAQQMLPPEVFQKIYKQANQQFSKPLKIIK